MRTSQLGGTTVFALLALWTASARGEVDSGPAEGEQAPALQVVDVTGYNSGKELDYVKDRQKAPTVYVLLQEQQWSRPMARLLKEVDKDIAKVDGAYLVVVWLTEDKDKTKEYLPKAHNILNLQNSALTYFPGDAVQGPNNWGFNDRAELTAVIVKEGKVTKTFGLQSTNETDAKKVVDALAK